MICVCAVVELVELPFLLVDEVDLFYFDAFYGVAHSLLQHLRIAGFRQFISNRFEAVVVYDELVDSIYNSVHKIHIPLLAHVKLQRFLRHLIIFLNIINPFLHYLLLLLIFREIHF